jgi:predicted CoA-substrate-specific enzyme activase
MLKLNTIVDQATQNFTNVIGVDIGSRTSKAVLLKGDEVYSAVVPTGVFMQDSADELIALLLDEADLKREDIRRIVGTGYGRIALHFDFAKNSIISEISAHGMGAHFLNPHTRTIIDIGGQDSKAIKIDPETGRVTGFVMNDKCAAGTGRFLEQVAVLLELEVEAIGDFSLRSTKELDITSRCVVFAESEVISLKALDEKEEDIAAAIFLASAQRVYTLLKRIKVEPDIVFSGGVSNNAGVRYAFEKLLGYPIPKTKLDMTFAGALGAAIYAQQYEDGQVEFDQLGKAAAQADLSALLTAIEVQEAGFTDPDNEEIKVGHMCSYTPLELMNAAGVRHTRLMKAGTNEEVSVGEMLTTSVFCDFTKSCLGAFKTGNPLFKSLDKIYLFDTCNSMRKTGEAIGSRFVDTSIFLLPRSHTDVSSKEYLRKEVLAFKRDLEKLTGHEIADEEVVRQIQLYNIVRKLIRKISDLRKRNHPPLNGRDFLDIVNAYYHLPPERLIPLLEDLYTRLAALPDDEKPLVRVMITGGIVAEGDRKILDLIEDDFGARVVVEDHCTGLSPVYHDLDEDGDPYRNLAYGYLGASPCARMVPLTERIAHAQHLAEEYQVDAVIYKYIKFCPCYGITRNSFLKHFQKAGIPLLEISTDYSADDIGQLKTRIEAFIEVLREEKSSGELKGRELQYASAQSVRIH